MVPVEVARIGAEGREEVAAIGALTQLEIAGMQPGPQLQAKLDEGDTPD
jgi:hypothetical protein